MRLTLFALAVPFLPLAFGCSAGNVQFNSSSTGASASGAGGTTSTSSHSSGSAGTGGAGTSGANVGGGIHIGTGGAGVGGGGTDTAEVFGQSATVLYKLDPTTKVVTTVAPFNGCNGQVIDIALDKDGLMYATTFTGFYKVDKTTAVCTHIADGGYPNSLSFVPQGTVDQNVEALVGYAGSTYVRIDPTTGAVTQIGAISGGYVSSGDIVSVIGGGTYLTVNGNGCGDCIIQVDPKTGALKSMIGALGHSSVYGLAFWGGAAYGFDASGEIFQIDLTNGMSTVIPIPNGPPGLVWYGAGSTTAAPLKPPN